MQARVWVVGVVIGAVLTVGAVAFGLSVTATDTVQQASPVERASGTSGSPTSGPTTTTTTAPTTTTLPPTTTTTRPLLPFQDGVSAASSRDYIREVQLLLSDQRYDPGNTDGRWTTSTTQAVWAFQRLHGWGAQSSLTPEQYAVLRALPPAPNLAPELGPDRAVVDISRQVLVLYRDNAVRLITSVSTGSGKRYCEKGSCGIARTPRGDFSFHRRINGWRTSRLGRLYKPIYFTGGYAVHGGPPVPSYPASHGCVRIPMPIAEYFPSLVPVNMPVRVSDRTEGAPIPPVSVPTTTTTVPPPTTSTTAAPATTTTSTTTTTILPPPTTTTSSTTTTTTAPGPVFP